MKNPFEIFNTPEDYGRWDLYIQQCDLIDGLRQEERASTKQAIRYLRDLLGTRLFLDSMFTDELGFTRVGHPLIQHLVNTSSWHRKWITQFAGALRTLEGAGKFDGLVDRIKDPARFSEGLSVLETGCKLRLQGFVVSFDEDATVQWRTSGAPRSSEKKPDLKIVNPETGEDMFVEVTELGESDQVKQTTRTYQSIWWLLHSRLFEEQFYPYARIKRTLDEGCLVAVIGRLNELIEQVRSTRTGVTYVEEGVIEVGIAPEDNKELVEKWALERGIKVGVDGPPHPLRETMRMKRAIRKELRQLPQDKPGIVAVRTTFNPLLVAYDLREVKAEMEEQARQYPHLFCTVLTQQSLQSSSTDRVAFTQDNYTFFKTVLADPHTEIGIILFNDGCSQSVSQDTRERLRLAFTGR